MPKADRKIHFCASQKPPAVAALSRMIDIYGQSEADAADVIVPLGGDGYMLETLRKYMDRVKAGTPVYGMNQGTVGFLMNSFSERGLHERLDAAEAAIIHPLRMTGENADGAFAAEAINEVSLLRETRQTAHIQITIDGRVRMEKLVADGILLATTAGSTAYNLSAHGPALPLGADVLALTPISAFRPRRWRGAILSEQAHVRFDIVEPEYRPVSATADDQEFRNIRFVDVHQDNDTDLPLLFDKDHGLEEKILREQFVA